LRGIEEDTTVTITVKAPEACDREDLKAFEGLVQKGAEVQSHGLAALIRQANALAFVHASGRLVGVAALKQPLASYRKSVFEKAATGYASTQYSVELGWVYVIPSERGKGISGRVLEALLKSAADVNMFATSRTDNAAMHRSLERFGFVGPDSHIPRSAGTTSFNSLCGLPPALERTRRRTARPSAYALDGRRELE